MSSLHRIGVLKGYTGNMSVLNGYKVHIVDTDDDDKILVVQPIYTRNGRGDFSTQGTLRTTLNNIDISNITNEKEGDKEKKEKTKGAEEEEEKEDNSNANPNKCQKSSISTRYKIIITEHRATPRNTHQTATPTMVISTTSEALQETNTMKLINECYDDANMSIDNQDPDSRVDKDALEAIIDRANTDPLTTVAKYGDDDGHKLAYINIST